MKKTHDIIISGGGMVGLSAAIAFARSGLSVAVIEKMPISMQLAAEFDGRVSALALGSVRLLQYIGVWQEMLPHAQAIYDIRVCEGNTNFFVHYNYQETGDDPFGYIVENRYIRHALQKVAAQINNIQIIDCAEIVEFNSDNSFENSLATIRLIDDRILCASLLIAADGKKSILREISGIREVSYDYSQTAIVCTIAHEKPHNGLAVEKFLPAGPFAVLPMVEQRSSLVWVEPTDKAGIYLSLSDEECEQEISERVGNHLGTIKLCGKRFSYPLSLVHARDYVATRFALIGDSAHGIHPIAGQGVNLGFRDVAALEELIRKQAVLGLDIGGELLLARYQRWRRFDNLSMIGATHGLNQLFCTSLIPVKLARGIGMWAVNKMPPLKKFFMKQAMGIYGNVPDAMQAVI